MQLIEPVFCYDDYIAHPIMATYKDTYFTILRELNMAPFVGLLERKYNREEITVEDHTILVRWSYWYLMETFKDLEVITKKTSIINNNIRSAKAGLSKAMSGYSMFYEQIIDTIYSHIDIPYDLTIEEIKANLFFRTKGNYNTYAMQPYSPGYLHKGFKLNSSYMNTYGDTNLRPVNHDDNNYVIVFNDIIQANQFMYDARVSQDYSFAYIIFSNIQLVIHNILMLTLTKDFYEVIE